MRASTIDDDAETAEEEEGHDNDEDFGPSFATGEVALVVPDIDRTSR